MRTQRKPKQIQLAIHLYSALDSMYDDPPAGLPRLSPKEFKAKYVLPWRDAKYSSPDEALARIQLMLSEAEAQALPVALHDAVCVESICAFVGVSMHYLRKDDREEAWSMFALAQHGLGVRAGADSGAAGDRLSAIASLGGKARAAKDPKQREKTFIKDCWQDWQLKPDTYKSKAAFAVDMLDKCEHLSSQKKIEDWCRTWESETLTLPAE
ncbi:hypothetical protein [Paraburkholderia sp. GAS42]|jgi:hypothetical protein|uniref:hypothetical protein n=1 Tax=Paraburkholderia sp. GAS42 TaxID=3035135 RepID=UPI003D21E2FA